jgi:hypothetical protein
VGALKGHPPGPLTNSRLCAREGAPASSSVDAIELHDTASAEAALERWLTASLGVVGARTLRRAEEAFAAVLGPPERGRLQHLPTIRRLLWALQRLDRYADQGQGREGAGLDVLERMLAGECDGLVAPASDRQGAMRRRGEELIRRHGGESEALFAYHPDLGGDRESFEAVQAARGTPPVAAPTERGIRHLAYFLPALLEEGRRWKHTWAPRIKAERRARGVDAATRAQRRYVRWLETPLSYDFRGHRRKASPAGPPPGQAGGGGTSQEAAS